MDRIKARRQAIALLVTVPLAEFYSGILKLFDQPMKNAWRMNIFFLIFQPLLIYYFCRGEKKVGKVEKIIPEMVNPSLLKRFWFWLKKRAKILVAGFNRFLGKIHAKTLFLGNIAMVVMAAIYFRLATMTLGLKSQPWKFLPGFAIGFVLKLYIAQKTGELFAQAVKWLCGPL